jgi:CspA family cold shock protein
MRLGTVRFFDVKGYGFITPLDGSEDLFFHVSQLPGKRGERTILEGTHVSFEIGVHLGKPVAKFVRHVPQEEIGGVE